MITGFFLIVVGVLGGYFLRGWADRLPEEETDAPAVRAHFPPDEVVKLWGYQFGPWQDPLKMNNDPSLPPHLHPFTCGHRDDHPVMAGDKGVLVPTVRGWECPFCDYRQDWAHGFMKGRPA